MPRKGFHSFSLVQVLLGLLLARLAAPAEPPGASPTGSQAPSGQAAAEPPAPAPGTPVVETIAGVHHGALTYAAAARSAAGAVETAGSLQVGSRPVPLEEVLFVRFVENPVAPAEVILFFRGGDELSVTITAGDESELSAEAPSVRRVDQKPLQVALEDLRGVAFPFRFKDPRTVAVEAARWFAAGERPVDRPLEERGPPRGKASPQGPGEAEDRVLLAEGAELTGVLLKLDARNLHFQSKSAGVVNLPLEKVQAVSIAALQAAREKEGAPVGLTVQVQFQDGSLLSGKLMALDRNSLRLFTASVGEVQCQVEAVRSLSVRGGRCQYLSDMQPAKVVHGADLFAPWPLRRDLSADGDPIRLRGRHYRKGLGMHSYTRADYDLGGQYSRFQTIAGMDDRARPETDEAERMGAGRAVFRVHVDGRTVFEKELSWSDAPQPLDVPVEGARTLSLELDYGPGFLVLDRGDWAEARLIRKG